MVIIFHSPLALDASPDEKDVLDQADFFREGLELLGYDVETMPFPYDMRELGVLLQQKRPQFVVNLVETLFADGRLIHAAPALFDHFEVPYTGCSGGALFVTSDKVFAKILMQAHGIPTPEFITCDMVKNNPDKISDMTRNQPYLIKSIWEHASFGLDEHRQLLFRGQEEISRAFADKGNRAAQYFAEQYIHGREFNVSLLAGPSGPEMLPPAEMQFDFPQDMPRIIGYRSKWDPSSYEYRHTNRSFPDMGPGTTLYDSLYKICLDCWKLFRLSGYVRIDFRLGEQGKLYVLEINANPCIAGDSGFVAAALHAGYDHQTIVSRIVGDMSGSRCE